MIPSTGRVLGLDWGTMRIGVALSDETQLVASALETVSRRTGRRLPLRRLLEQIERHAPVGIVVGVPLDDDGLEGPAAIAAREMGRVVSARSKLPIDWIDESFTTTDALRSMRASGQRVEPGMVDARAAAGLLQQWLDRRARGPRA